MTSVSLVRRRRSVRTRCTVPPCVGTTQRHGQRRLSAVHAPHDRQRGRGAWQARAFWVRSPGGARSARSPARARPGGGPGAHAPLRGEPRHRDAGLPRRRPTDQRDGMRAPLPGGRLPRAGEVRLPQRRRGRARPARAARPDRVLPVPAPDRVRRPGVRGRHRCPTACRPRGRCWRAPSRPPSTRCGTPRPLVGDRVTVVGAGMVGCCVARLLARHPGVDVTLVDVDPSRAAAAEALGVRFAIARGRSWRPRPGRARQRDLRGAPALAGAARAGRRPWSTSAGTATARSSCPWAAPSTPGG